MFRLPKVVLLSLSRVMVVLVLLLAALLPLLAQGHCLRPQALTQAQQDHSQELPQLVALVLA